MILVVNSHCSSFFLHYSLVVISKSPWLNTEGKNVNQSSIVSVAQVLILIPLCLWIQSCFIGKSLFDLY